MIEHKFCGGTTGTQGVQTHCKAELAIQAYKECDTDKY